MRLLLDRMLRLAYHERVAKAIPTELLPLLPPKPQGCLAWDQVREGDIDPNSQPSLSAALLGKLRTKEPHAEVIAWLDSLSMPPPKRAELVLHSLLHAGAKSISHLEKLLEKFSPLLTHVAADAGGGAALVRLRRRRCSRQPCAPPQTVPHPEPHPEPHPKPHPELHPEPHPEPHPAPHLAPHPWPRPHQVGLLFAYWSRSSQLVQVALQKMVRHGVVDSAALQHGQTAPLGGTRARLLRLLRARLAAPGGSGCLGTPRGRSQPLLRLLDRAASKSAD